MPGLPNNIKSVSSMEILIPDDLDAETHDASKVSQTIYQWDYTICDSQRQA